MGIIKNKKRAFTLAEVMIVLLVLTILFAAMAPLITKKRTATRDEDFWNWSGRGFGKPMNAQKTNTDGSIFFGTTPMSTDDVSGDTFSPSSKVIIRSGVVADNKIQRQIQFRYQNDLTGTMLADGSNLLLGHKYIFLGKDKGYNDLEYPKNNLAIGYNSLENLKNDANDNTAVGSHALYSAAGSRNTAVGYKAGYSSYGSENVFIGSEANSQYDRNTLIGYKSKSNGNNNTFIGAESGNINAPNNNTAIGSETLNKLKSGYNNYNIAIGYGALNNLETGSNNVAIGYNACSNLTNSSNKTCIGAGSGPKNKNTVYNNNDSHYRTFIGTQESTKFGGDAVLEIHNMNTTSDKLVNNPNIKSNTTTVINGNLIVKGKTYFTVGNYLYPFTFNNKYFGVSNVNSPCNTDQRSYGFGTCSSSINLSSDRRLKYIGSRYNAGLDEINKLQVYNYTYKNDSKKEPHTGVIAQQLMKVFPSAVSKDEDGYLRIRWDEMFYACINAIKTLNQRVASLVKRTLSLEDEITKLEKENSRLKAEVESISSRVEKIKALQK